MINNKPDLIGQERIVADKVAGMAPKDLNEFLSMAPAVSQFPKDNGSREMQEAEQLTAWLSKLNFSASHRMRGEPMLRLTLLAVSLAAIAMIACSPSATTSESDSGTNPKQPVESNPALLLDEDSAILILQTFLQECLQSWDGPYRTSQYNVKNPLTEQEMKQLKNLLMDLATGENGDFPWSANYHRVTEVPNVYTPLRTAVKAETWVVIGPGLERAGSQVVIPGRWKIYAEHQRASYVDAPARLALEEYNRFLTCYR